MNALRRWLLTPQEPFYFMLAADTRLSPTDYTDDQVWRLTPGMAENPALALQTQLGGRVGLVSIVPMWQHAEHTLYEAQSYATPPQIVSFAPGYLRVQASLTETLKLGAEYWAIDSHTLGSRFTLRNTADQPADVHLELFGHVGAKGQELPLRIILVGEDQHVLSLGRLGNINPIVMLEDGYADQLSSGTLNARIGRHLQIAPQASVTLRWVYAGLPETKASVLHARHWLNQNWQPHIQQIIEASQAIPAITTGERPLDLTLATAYNQLVTVFIGPTQHLPDKSFVAKRDFGTGYSRQHDGSDYPREWDGQTPHLAYLVALGMAPINAELAQGIIHNYLSVQRDDGWIDWKPGLGGQRQGLLCMPILARLAWSIFQYTEDETFLQNVRPGLLRFLERWLQRDTDGIPQWQHIVQTGYVHWPSFGIGQPWADNTDISTVETPDLLAYLLSEAVSLKAMAYYFHDSATEAHLTQIISTLQAHLLEMWDGQRFAYRDCDTRLTEHGRRLLHEGAGDAEHLLAQPLTPPARLNIRITGGVDHTPRFRLAISGLDAQGNPLEKLFTSEDFLWQRRQGTLTTKAVFSQVDRLHSEGLSRVYRITVTTPNLTTLDINAVLPLWSAALPENYNTSLVELIRQPEHFWRNSGPSICSAQEPTYDAKNSDGSGGVWPYWATLIGEALIETGHCNLAAQMLFNLLNTQATALYHAQHFSEFYHTDQPKGLGTPAHLGGIVPLHLLLRVLGVRIISAHKVWIGGLYHWPHPVAITQHGVTVQRTATTTRIDFASGGSVTLDTTPDWQAVTDPAR